MRVTQQIIFSNFMRDINRNRSEMAEIQSDLSSGRDVRSASKDPVAFQSSRVIEENIRKTEQFQSNINSGLRQGRLAQEALDDVLDRLIEVKETVVKGSSSSFGENERENMAEEVAGIKKNLVNTLNLSYGDRYLFAGTNSGEAPFELDDAAPGGVSNQSNNKAPEILAADGVNIEISVTGEELADTESGDLFKILGDIENSLRANDTEALNQMLGASEDAIEHVTNVTSRLGNNINRMDYMYQQYESTVITQNSDVSELVDTNYAQSFSDLQRNQVAFESAMAVHSTMFQNTLLDYM